jgi:hypothetical protein
MATVKEKLDAVAAIYQDAQAKAAPLLAELEPYLDAAKAAHKLGLTADSTADEIIAAFANRVDLTAPNVNVVPSVLEAGAPGQIQQAGEQLVATWQLIGTTIGQVVGIIAGLR